MFRLLCIVLNNSYEQRYDNSVIASGSLALWLAFVFSSCFATTIAGMLA